jgi:hypothetical protein
LLGGHCHDEKVDLLEKQVDRDRTNVASDFRTVLATINLASHFLSRCP